MKEYGDDPLHEALTVNDSKKQARKGRKNKHIFRGDPNYYNIQNNLVEKNKENSDIENDIGDISNSNTK